MSSIVENKAELSVVIIIKQLRETLSSTWYGGGQHGLEVRDLRTIPHHHTNVWALAKSFVPYFFIGKINGSQVVREMAFCLSKS